MKKHSIKLTALVLALVLTAALALTGCGSKDNGSAADGDPCGHDHFQRLHPDTNWRSCLEHGEKIGIGTRDYELIKI